MPIEFQCPACQAALRVPDTAIGKQAKCPRCGQIVTVVGAPPNEPDLGVGPAGPPPIGQPPVPPVPPDVNPYAPPQTPVSYLPPVDQGLIEPQIISFSDTFSTTWQMFFDNFGSFLGMGALLFGLTFIGNILMNLVSFTFVAMEDEAAFVVLGISMFILMLVMIAANMWLQGGMLRYSVELAKGMRPTFGRVFLPFDRFLGYFAVTLLSGLAVSVGFILLIIPGIILMLMFTCAPAVYLDGKAGVLDSLSVSTNITRGNRLTILGLFLVNFLLAFLATVLTCGLAWFLTEPFFALLTAVIYTRSTGLFASARPPVAQVSPMNWMPPQGPGLR